MKTKSIAVYQENRAKFPVDELRKYDGQWVAFSADGLRIVAGAGNIADLAEKVRSGAESLSDVMIEHVEFDFMDGYYGAAELS